MSATAQETTAASEAPAVTQTITIPSVRARATKVSLEHRQTLLAEKAARKPAPVEKPQKAAPPKKADSNRLPSAQIAKTIIPPTRTKSHLQDALREQRPAHIKKLQQDCQTLRNGIEGKGPNGEPTTPLTEPNLSQAKAMLAKFEQQLADENAKKYEFRVSDEAPAVVAAFLNWIVMAVYDTTASNMLTKNLRTLSPKFLVSPAHIPTAEEGGVSLAASPAGPFISQLPIIRNWDPAEEEILAKAHTAEGQRKKEERAARAEAAAAAGGEAEKTPVQRRRREGPTSFLTFILDLIHESAPTISDEYEGLRIDWRMKEVLDAIVQQSIQSIAAGIAPLLLLNGSVTVSGTMVQAYLLSIQRAAQRPQNEIDTLRNSTQHTMDAWKAHSVNSKESRLAREREAFLRRTDAERNALETKKAMLAEAKKTKNAASAAERAVTAAAAAGNLSPENMAALQAAQVQAAAAAAAAKAAADQATAQAKAIVDAADAQRKLEAEAAARVAAAQAAANGNPVGALLAAAPAAQPASAPVQPAGVPVQPAQPAGVPVQPAGVPVQPAGVPVP